MPFRPDVIRQHRHAFLCQKMPERNLCFRLFRKSLHYRLFRIFVDLCRQHNKPMHKQVPDPLLRWQHNLPLCFELSFWSWLLCWSALSDLCQELSQWNWLGQFRRSHPTRLCYQVHWGQLRRQQHSKMCAQMPLNWVGWRITQSLRRKLYCPPWTV
jgi:hypothetical protein